MSATLYDKLVLVPTVGLILGRTLAAAVTGPLRGPEGAPTYTEHVGRALVRGLTLHMRIETAQWIMPSFVDSYRSWCKKNSQVADVVTIANTPNHTQGFWMGSKATAKYTMVFYHGGGFVFTGSPQHLDFLANLVRWSNGTLAIFCVCYSLSPGSVYPTALAECVEALRYVLDDPARSPSTTLLGGDSAGGNLVLAVLSHISAHPHPRSDVVQPLRLSANLKAALVVAPWTSSDETRYASMRRLAGRDIVGPAQAHYWIAAYKGRDDPVPDDEYICAATADAEWWKGTRCRDLLALAGEDETLIDAITDWAGKYAKGMGDDRIEYVIGARETHDTPLQSKSEEEVIRLGKKCQEGAIRLWVKEKLV